MNAKHDIHECGQRNRHDPHNWHIRTPGVAPGYRHYTCPGVTEQDMPEPNSSPAIQDLVAVDLADRKMVGIAKYGTPLQADNGRDALRDAYEEVLDLACYLRQMMEERDTQQSAESELLEAFAGWEAAGVDKLSRVDLRLAEAFSRWAQFDLHRAPQPKTNTTHVLRCPDCPTVFAIWEDNQGMNVLSRESLRQHQQEVHGVAVEIDTTRYIEAGTGAVIERPKYPHLSNAARHDYICQRCFDGKGPCLDPLCTCQCGKAIGSPQEENAA